MLALNNHSRRIVSTRREFQEETALRRLARLIMLEKDHVERLNDNGVRLLRNCIFSCYCDCRELGLTEKAQRILRQSASHPLKSALLHPALPAPTAEVA